MQVLWRNKPGKQEVYNIIKVIEEHNFFSIGAIFILEPRFDANFFT